MLWRSLRCHSHLGAAKHTYAHHGVAATADQLALEAAGPEGAELARHARWQVLAALEVGHLHVPPVE